MFRTNNEGHGFQITFPNRYTVSIQFGIFNYCNNKLTPYKDTAPEYCRDAEVALVHPDGWLVSLEGKFDWWSGDTVNGYTSPNEVAELIAYAQALPVK